MNRPILKSTPNRSARWSTQLAQLSNATSPPAIACGFTPTRVGPSPWAGVATASADEKKSARNLATPTLYSSEKLQVAVNLKTELAQAARMAARARRRSNRCA